MGAKIVRAEVAIQCNDCYAVTSYQTHSPESVRSLSQDYAEFEGWQVVGEDRFRCAKCVASLAAKEKKVKKKKGAK